MAANLKQTLINNIIKLMQVKGINKAKMTIKAKQGGYSLHSTTIKNILENEHDTTLTKLEAMAYALGVDATMLLWEQGFDDDGRPIGANANIPLDVLTWAVKKVMLSSSYMQIDDLDFQSHAIAAVAKVACDKGTDFGAMEFEKQLALYNFNKPK